MIDKSGLETLNVVQQVLRHFMLSLAAAGRADMHVLGVLLEKAATNDALEPEACAMLADLAAGATGIAAAGMRKS